MSHLSQNTRMILRQTIGKGAKVGRGMGKNLQKRQMVLSSTPKRNYHGIGYQPHDQGENGRIQKGNRMTKPYLAFPPLNLTFKSRGYINASLSRENEDVVMPLRALTISVIIEDEDIVETARPAMYPCPLDFELDNWSIVEIPIAHKLSK